MTSKHELLQTVKDILSTTEAFVVGGAVRNRLLNRPILDFDIILPKDPSLYAKAMAEKLGGSFFPLDVERGVIRVSLSDGFHFDLAQRQGEFWADDLDRRDFSINALAVPMEHWAKRSWEKHLWDRHNGLMDLKKKQMNAISKRVFQEDPLRLLRAFRIGGELGFTLSKDTLALIKKNGRLIKKSAPERIREEMLKIFSLPNSYETLMVLEQSGLLDVLLPEMKALRKTAPAYYGKGGVLTHILESIDCFEFVLNTLNLRFPKTHAKIKTYVSETKGGYPRLAHLKWALLLHDIGKAATAKKIGGRLRFFEHEHAGANRIPVIAPRFRWSNEETASYARLVRNHMRPGNLATHPDLTDKAMHRFFKDLEEDAIGLLLLSLGDHLTYLTPRQKKKRNSAHEKLVATMVNRYYLKKEKILPPKILSGYDVMKAFRLSPSPLIGELLKDLSEAQTEKSIKTKEEAINYLKTRVAFFQEKAKAKAKKPQ